MHSRGPSALVNSRDRAAQAYRYHHPPPSPPPEMLYANKQHIVKAKHVTFLFSVLYYFRCVRHRVYSRPLFCHAWWCCSLVSCHTHVIQRPEPPMLFIIWLDGRGGGSGPPFLLLSHLLPQHPTPNTPHPSPSSSFSLILSLLFSLSPVCRFRTPPSPRHRTLFAACAL